MSVCPQLRNGWTAHLLAVYNKAPLNTSRGKLQSYSKGRKYLTYNINSALVFLVCVCTSVWIHAFMPATTAHVQPCYTPHVIVSICPWVSNINPVMPGTSQVPSPYKTNKSCFFYSLVDLVRIVLSTIPSPSPLRAAFTTPHCEIIQYQQLLELIESQYYHRTSWKWKKNIIKFRKLSACRTRHVSLFWLILLVLYIFNIKSSLNFLCRNARLWCISSMNARHDWQNLVFVPDNCCLLLTGLEWTPDIFRFTACRCGGYRALRNSRRPFLNQRLL